MALKSAPFFFIASFPFTDFNPGECAGSILSASSAKSSSCTWSHLNCLNNSFIRLATSCVVLTASNVDIDFGLKVKKGPKDSFGDKEATNILPPEKLNNYEPRNLWYECSSRSFNETFTFGPVHTIR